MTNTGAGEWYGSGTAKGDGEASAKDLAKDAVKTVKQEAATFAADAKDKAVEAAEQHKETATKTLGDFADAIRKAGEELSSKDQSLAGRLVGQAADGLESLSRSVSDKRPEELLDAVRDFGRRNPTAFVAGSVLVGLALGRFLKSTGTHNGFGAAGFTAPGGAPATYLPSDDSFAADELSGDTTDVVGVGATSIGAMTDELDAGLEEEVAMDDDGRDLERFNRGTPGTGTGV